MILTEAVIIALCKVVEKTLELVMLTIKDQPQAERMAAWQRWFDFWAPFWKAVGLDPAKKPL